MKARDEMDKDCIINGYKVLAEKLEERYLDLTIRQYHELETALHGVWSIVERRKHGKPTS